MNPGLVRVTVAFCAEDAEDITELSLPAGATVRDAIDASQLYARRPELNHTGDAGIWGRRCSLDRTLTDGDRVELYRPLTIDPMEARRLRGKRRAAPSALRAPAGGGRAATRGEQTDADLRRKRRVKG